MPSKVPEGWKPKDSLKFTPEPSSDSPINSVGQPQLEENEIVVEDGLVNSRQYFLVQDSESGNYRVHVPGLGKDNDCYIGPYRSLRASALEDGYKVLQAQPPKEFLKRAQYSTGSGITEKLG